MGAAFFYHLTESPLEATLPMLLTKSRQAGWRVLVRGPAPLLQRLDQVLWEGDPDGFLPHGMAGGAHDADQPILLGDVPADGFDCVMSVGGAAITSSEVGLAQRVCVLFDGADGEALQTARDQWKGLTGEGCQAQYWAQDDGRWVKKAEAGGGEA